MARTDFPAPRAAGAAVAAGLLLFLASAPGGAAVDEEAAGPVPLRILAPLHVLSYQFTPQRAEPLAAGRSVLRLELSESNVLHCPHGEAFLFDPDLDFEMSRLQLAYRRGLGRGWEAGLEIPLLYYHSGFMDETVFQVEEAFGKLKPQRKDEVPGSFAFEVRRAGETVFAGPANEVGLGDVALTAGRSLVAGGGWRPSVALRAALELPSGDRDRAFGNGIPELALGIAADWRHGPWSLRSGGGVTFPLDQVDGTPGLTSVPVLSGYAEIAYRRGRRLGLHFQAAAQSGPFRLHGRFESGPSLPKTDRGLTHHVFQMSPAVSWRLAGERTFFLGIVEDFHNSEDSAADITMFAVVDVGL